MTVFENDKNWVKDANGNRCSVEYFGSETAAQKALDSLIDCSDCSDCSRCSRCSDLAPQKAALTIPSIPNIHRAIYDAASKPGCLKMDTWHCGTSHCRAGWVVHLAGEAGYALEAQTTTLFAAQQIYKASGYDISPVRFYDSNEDALADMKRLAEAE